jgi:ABC-type transport system involved in cytochrome c biogenesis permease subunit
MQMIFGGAYTCFLIAFGVHLAYLARMEDKIGLIGTAMNSAGGLFLLVGLGLRSYYAGQLPFFGLYETLLFFTLSIVCAHLLMERLTEAKAVGAFSLAIALLLGAYAIFVLPPTAKLYSLPHPFLSDVLFQTHILATLIAYGFFASSCGASFLYLIRDALSKRSFVASWPSLEKIDEIIYRAAVIGFALLSFGISVGAWFFYRAFGSFWSWELAWTFIVWLVYLAFFHARSMRWRGRLVALMSILGFAFVLLAVFAIPFYGV